MGKKKVQTIKNGTPSGTLDNRLSTTGTEIVCTLEFYLMKRLDDRSRMKREFHVRFCESLRRKFPRATRLCEAKKMRPFLRQLKQALCTREEND